MADLPIVTLVTPSYNQAQFLEETILSVLNQDYPNLEYIIIDGGSADGSVDIIRKYESRLAYWVSEPDLGQSHAVNKGFLWAEGDILAWVNSDDLLCPGAVRAAADFLGSHPDVSVVYGGANIIDEGGQVMLPMEQEDFDLARCLVRLVTPIPNPSAFFRRETSQKIGLLDEKLHYYMDFEYWIRVAMAGLQISRIPETLAQIRVHHDAKTVGHIPRPNEELLAWLDRFFSRPLPPEIASLQRQSKSRALLELGLKSFYVHQFSEGRRAIFKGLGISPRTLVNNLLFLLPIIAVLPNPAIRLAIQIKERLFPSPNQRARDSRREADTRDRRESHRVSGASSQAPDGT
ncbi:glycosyltransferase family 2 protein [Candidatus Methylomirabilis sp.]|uniref:glycosyltransferase family 2 protein n=1 Tax=Candidatus Methylomirabilis sp. TaxID=2032687 RepID=UPI0030760DE1